MAASAGDHSPRLQSCRLRWINYLRPDVKRGRFEEDEEDLIVKLHALLGNRWSLIAGRLPGGTDNEVKNYWNSHLRKKLASMGIDPDNHRVIHNARLHRSHSSSNATRSSIDKSTNGLQNNSENGFRDDDDLNLDLTISLPSSQRTGSDHLQNTASRTLLLFP
ncbi:hypothetical protein MUK42_15376 [Musa troglodytarum]|uniref:MYB transcription factor n=1 Tax=Musa troglodytarum TaxID=320322 RepID=A0A9E7L1A9_9LILI|nr:hypothetical protein MUK42_15376 [Musa troglodytarum]